MGPGYRKEEDRFISAYCSRNIYIVKKVNNYYNDLIDSKELQSSVSSRQMNISPQQLDGNKSNIVDGSTDSTSELSLNTGVACLTSHRILIMFVNPPNCLFYLLLLPSVCFTLSHNLVKQTCDKKTQ